MSTIQQFLTTLHKHTDDKKSLLNDRYQENSVWLSNEFELILKLIRPDSKENNSEESSNENVVQNVPQVETICGDNSEKLIDFNSKKRKSPATALSSSNLSPEQKRQSIDIEKLKTNAGLPADLSTLTIKDLGAALKKLGKPELVKGWKKADYVSALKSALLEEASLSARNDKQSSESSESEPAPNVVLFANFPPTTPGKGPRKIGSTMGDFRSKMNQDAVTESLTQPQPVAQEVDASEKTRLEFKERQNRHRDSQARKSQIMEAIKHSELNDSGPITSTTDSSTDSAPIMVDEPVETEVVEAVEQVLVSSASHPLSLVVESTPIDSPEEEDEGENSMASPSGKGSMFMDIASPVPPERSSAQQMEAPSSSHKMTHEGEEEESEEQDEVNIDSEVEQEEEGASPVETAIEVEEDEEESDETAPEDEVEEEPEEASVEENETQDEEDAEIVQSLEESNPQEKDTQPVSVDTQDTVVLEYSSPVQEVVEEVVSPVDVVVDETPVIAPVVVKTVAAPVAAVVVKKPLNLMSSIDKAPVVPAKTVVPALEKAKQLRAAEDAKLAAKKKEMELKLAAQKEQKLAAAAKSAPVVAPKTAVRPVATVSAKIPTSSKESAPVTSGSVAAMAANLNNQSAAVPKEKEAKKGILGAAISTVLNFGKKTPTKPAQDMSAASASGGKSTFDISVVETKPTEVVKPSAGFTTLQSKAVDSGSNHSKSSAPVASAVVTPSKKPDLFGDKAKMNAILNSYNAVNNQQSMSALTASAAPIVDLHKAAAVAFNKPIATPHVVSTMQSPAPKAPLNSGSVLRDITEKIVTSGNNSHTAVTPGAKTAPAVSAEKEYQIEDRESSDEENDSGTDEEAEGDKKKAQQSVPEWAKGAKLKEALEKQYGMHGHTPMDPDTIFHEVQTCSLEEIFGAKEGHNRKYSKRTSSAHWDADQLTLVEKRTYRNHMGYAASTRPSAVN